MHWPLLLLAVTLGVLASCSTVRLSYDHADWLLGYTASQYVELDKDQWRTFKTELAQFHTWHRQRELPQYAEAFDEAALRIEHGMSRADVEWAIGVVRGRARVLGIRAAEDFAPVVATLSERQLREIEERFAKDNGKFVKTQLTGDIDTLAKHRADWLESRVEDFTGSLTGAQRARVLAFARAFPDGPRLRLEERERRQGVFLHIAREAHGDPKAAARLLRSFLEDPERGRSEAVREGMQRWERGLADMLVDIERTLAPAQRAAAARRFRSYAADFRQLAGQLVASPYSPISPAAAEAVK